MKTILALAASGALALAATAASAQNGPPPAVREACAADAVKLCPDMTGKAVHECMMAHKDEVSQGCKDAYAKAMQDMQGMKADKPN